MGWRVNSTANGPALSKRGKAGTEKNRLLGEQVVEIAVRLCYQVSLHLARLIALDGGSNCLSYLLNALLPQDLLYIMGQGGVMESL